MKSKSKIKVLVADPQRLLFDALSCCLRNESDIELLEEHPVTGMATVDLAAIFHPDVLLIEYWMETLLAPAVIQAINTKVPNCKPIVFSWLHGSREILNSLYAGAVGFIPKGTSTVDQIIDGIRRAHAGDTRTLREDTEGLLKQLSERDEEAFEVWEKMKGLTHRELQTLALVSLGKSLKEISDTLSITPKTARNHLDNMMRKTGAQTQIQLLAMARQCGLIAG